VSLLGMEAGPRQKGGSLSQDLRFNLGEASKRGTVRTRARSAPNRIGQGPKQLPAIGGNSALSRTLIAQRGEAPRAEYAVPGGGSNGSVARWRMQLMNYWHGFGIKSSLCLGDRSMRSTEA